MNLRRGFAALLALSAAGGCGSTAPPAVSTFLLTNPQLLDGTGAPGRTAAGLLAW